MDNTIGITLVVLLVMAAVFTGGAFVLRFKLYNRMAADVEAGNLDRFFRDVDGFLVRTLVSPYGRERLRFRALASQGDRTRLAEQFNGLMKMKLGDYERGTLLTDGFNAFAALGDRKHAKRILDEMGKAGFESKALAAYHRHFDVVLDHKTDGRAALEESYARLTGRRRGYAAYLLSRIHETNKDGKAEAYRAEAAKLYGVPVEQLDRRIHVNTSV